MLAECHRAQHLCTLVQQICARKVHLVPCALPVTGDETCVWQVRPRRTRRHRPERVAEGGIKVRAQASFVQLLHRAGARVSA